jgi:hypothetical protein
MIQITALGNGTARKEEPYLRRQRSLRLASIVLRLEEVSLIE